MFRIKKGDLVYIRTGKDKGKTGKVMRVFGANKRALVEGINKIKKAMRRSRENQKGGIIERETPVHISNIQIYCKNCSKPSRIGVLYPDKNAQGKSAKKKIRICRRCKEAV